MSMTEQDIAEIRAEQLHNLGECDPCHCEWCAEEEED